MPAMYQCNEYGERVPCVVGKKESNACVQKTSIITLCTNTKRKRLPFLLTIVQWYERITLVHSLHSHRLLSAAFVSYSYFTVEQLFWRVYFVAWFCCGGARAKDASLEIDRHISIWLTWMIHPSDSSLMFFFYFSNPWGRCVIPFCVHSFNCIFCFTSAFDLFLFSIADSLPFHKTYGMKIAHAGTKLNRLIITSDSLYCKRNNEFHFLKRKESLSEWNAFWMHF